MIANLISDQHSLCLQELVCQGFAIEGHTAMAGSVMLRLGLENFGIFDRRLADDNVDDSRPLGHDGKMVFLTLGRIERGN